MQDANLIKHLKEERCTGGNMKIICSRGKFKYIVKEKVFYNGDTKFSYTACHLIEAEAAKMR